jgi:Ca2+/Na+ antiporter
LIFTNAVEWFGKKLNLGQGVVGSILAAVGTAMPETIIPIIAILFHHDEKFKEIGIGAIAGAPFMLGTLAFFVTGIAVLIYAAMGKRTIKMNADTKVQSIRASVRRRPVHSLSIVCLYLKALIAFLQVAKHGLSNAVVLCNLSVELTAFSKLPTLCFKVN